MSEVLKKKLSTVKDSPRISVRYIASLLFFQQHQFTQLHVTSVTITVVELDNSLKSGIRSNSGTRTLVLMQTCHVPLKM